ASAPSPAGARSGPTSPSSNGTPASPPASRWPWSVDGREWTGGGGPNASVYCLPPTVHRDLVRLRPGGADEARAAVVGEVVVDPADEHAELVPEAGEVDDVDDDPADPGDPARGRPPARQLEDGRVPADGRHLALVAVAERPRRLPAQRPLDLARGVDALLHRHLRHLRVEPPLGVRGPRHVAGHEDLGVPRHAERLVHDDAP